MGAASIRQAITTALSTAGVKAIVGVRVHPLHGAPLDPVRPFIIWRRAGGEAARGLLSGGASGQPRRAASALSVECHTNTVAELDALTDAVMAAVRAFTPTSVVRSLQVVGAPTDLVVQNEGSNQYIPAARIDIAASVAE
jgi:hypothetical protein